MFVSFGHRLRGLGGMHVGFRMNASSGCFFVFLYGFINVIIYTLWFGFLGVLWAGYGLGYLCFYLPIKGIVKLCKQRKPKKRHVTFDDADHEPQKIDREKAITIGRWVGAASFALMAIYAISTLSVGGVVGALLFLLGGVIIVPLDVVENLRSQLKMTQTVSLILAVALLIVGVIITPTFEDSIAAEPDPTPVESGNEEPSGSGGHNSLDAVIPEEESTTPPKTPTTNNSPTPAPEQDPVDNIVYYTSSGSKYHSRKTCTGLNNAKNIYSIDLESAKEKGLSSCSKCH